MSSVHPSSFLRYALLGDAIASGATGLLAFAGAGLLASLLGLPEPLLRYAGLVLLPYAFLVGWLGMRADVPRAGVWTVVVANALWAADSVLLLASAWIAPTTLGVAFVMFQAVVVAAFAAAQAYGVRRGQDGARVMVLGVPRRSGAGRPLPCFRPRAMAHDLSRLTR